MPYFIKVLTIFSLIVTAACSSLKEYTDVKKPTANIIGASVADISLKDITLNTRVKVDNPNAFAIKTSGMDLDLSVLGNQVARIKQKDEGISLPAKGSGEMMLPIKLSYSDLLDTVKGLTEKNEAAYGIEGNVKVALPVLGDIKIPVKYNDVLPIPQMPKISLKDVKLDKASLTNLKLKLDMEVENPNAFAMTLQSLGLNISANNKALTTAAVDSIAVAKGGKQIVSVPVEVSVKDIGMSVFNMLTEKGSTVFKMDGVANILPEIGNWKAEAWNFSAEKEVKR